MSEPAPPLQADLVLQTQSEVANWDLEKRADKSITAKPCGPQVHACIQPTHEEANKSNKRLMMVVSSTES